jgi:phage/plasmid-like protein (TIGR03299 family)
MAHELNFTNGTADFVSLRQSAWHQLGTVIDTPFDYDTAVEKANLHYPLSLRPVQVEVPIFDINGKEVDSMHRTVGTHHVVTRNDTYETLGVVGNRYQLVENQEAFAIVEAMVDEGLAQIETAGVLRGGADAWMMVKFIGSAFEQASALLSRDLVEFFGLVRANHDGQASLQIGTTPIRVVCANTLAMATRSGKSTLHSVRHTRSAGAKLVEAARQSWGTAAVDALSQAQAFKAMAETLITESQFAATALDTFAPVPTLEAGASDRAKQLFETRAVSASADRQLLTQLWMSGTGQDGTPSAWAAFNAVTEAIDHKGLGAAVRGAAKAESLVGQLPGGGIAKAKSAVWGKLLALTV